MRCIALFALGFWLIRAGLAQSAVPESYELTTATETELQADSLYRSPYVRVEIRYGGLYRITGQELADAGVDLAQIVPSRLSIRNEKKPVARRVTVADPQRFTPSDKIEFFGSPPLGTFTYLKVDNLSNVYYISWTEAPSPNLRLAKTPGQGSVLDQGTFLYSAHMEKDYQFRFSHLPPGTTDGFYWLPIHAGVNPKGMFPLYLDFPGLNASAGLPINLKMRVVGHTEVPTLTPDHWFKAHYGEHDLGEFKFDGLGFLDYQTSLPTSLVGVRQRLTFSTPAGRENAVDQVGLESLIVEYPRYLDAGGEDYFVFNNKLIGARVPAPRVRVTGLQPGSEVFNLRENTVYSTEPRATDIVITMLDQPTTYVAVSPNGRMKADHLFYRPAPATALLHPDSKTEVLVISHPRVSEAAQRYVDYRRSRGLNTRNVLVTDVFDVLSEGFVSDVSLKRYIQYVASKAPGLRYIVLFGDSTYDFREARTFAAERAPHVLIPIHWIHNPSVTWSGGYQDDNWYGSFAEPFRPDVAVGRIPVNDNAEGMEYVRKVIEHEVLAKGKQDQLLMISSVEKSFQELVNEIGKQYKDTFTSVSTLFPETSEATQEIERIRQQVNKGVNLLYYVGHGGAMVWRVGPTDYQKQKDLFTPAEVSKLTNKGHYPVVLCSSCYTTSFDQERSLGEAFVLQPDAGALALIGSPWKATVHESHAFNSKVIHYYADPKVKRLGDAFVKAHRDVTPIELKRPSFQTVTLLGDPCLEILRR